MSWKKVVIGGALVSAGFYKMFDMLILDKTVLQTLDDTDTQFVAYLALYNKPYNNLEEYRYRKMWFAKTAKIVSQQDYGAAYKLTLNHMADWSDEEYNQMLGVLRESQKGPQPDRAIDEPVFDGGSNNQNKHSSWGEQKYPDRPMDDFSDDPWSMLVSLQ